MKYFLIAICHFVVAQVYANELEIFSPTFYCIKPQVNSMHSYEYFAGFYIKNISSSEVTIITQADGHQLIVDSKNNYGIYFKPSGGGTINDIPIIPSIVSLELVTLRPGEATFIDKRFGSKHLIEKAQFIYAISDEFDGRFGFWNGYTNLNDVKLQYPERCKI